ncbi:hypothetical protein EBZ37_00060 [bacterium]|nr:hypothetical protein [bacterium]
MEERNRHEPFDRTKYLSILDSEGLSAALTVLHADIEQLEYESFDGTQGWNPDLFEKLKKIRTFSRELWDIQLNSPEKSAGKKLK